MAVIHYARIDEFWRIVNDPNAYADDPRYIV